MVDWVERFVVEKRESAGGEGTDEEGTEQAGSVSNGDSGDAGPVVALRLGVVH